MNQRKYSPVASLFVLTIALSVAVGVLSSGSSHAQKANNSATQKQPKEKTSDELKSIAKNNGGGRASVILQAADVNSSEFQDLIKRHGGSIEEAMPEGGAVKVNIALKDLEDIAGDQSTSFVSSDAPVESFGHITLTTGADAVRSMGSNDST